MKKDTAVTGLTAEEALRLARLAAESQLGSACGEATALTGGLTNHVFEVHHSGEAFIVRLSDAPDKLRDYHKEEWAGEAARAKGIPVPKILHIGKDPIGFPYMIAPKITGEDASGHAKRLKIVAEMGKMTAVIHTIATHGYGRAFDWTSDPSAKHRTWGEFLDEECEVETRTAFLDKKNLLAPGQLTCLREMIDGMRKWPDKPVLNHGDMRLKNVLVDSDGEIQAVIDWENCMSAIPPYWDLSIALHDLSVDAKEAFVEGYGLSAKAFRDIAPYIKALNILNYVPVVRHAMQDRDTDHAEKLRSRLQGAFDLYLFC